MTTDNLLEETLHKMEYNNKQENDVDWVGSRDGKYAINWNQFKAIGNIKYDSGFGGQEIAPDLVIVFKDGTWLERHEYDGSEWWEYKETPQRQKEATPFTKIKSDYSDSIDDLNIRNDNT